MCVRMLECALMRTRMCACVRACMHASMCVHPCEKGLSSRVIMQLIR